MKLKVRVRLNGVPAPKGVPSKGKGKRVVEIIKDKEYDVWLKSAPENNKANVELIKLLSKSFKVPGGSVKIVRGKTSRKKVVEINGN